MKFPFNEARNFKLQAGGADLYNLTIVEIASTVPEASFVFGMHDSQYWQVSLGRWVALFSQIQRIATRPRMINGQLTPFPASFKVIYDDGRVEKVSTC